ncbi:MAG TPA: DUF1036 domain-containing protein, partial [Xanthobacteraceae bacterium]|nr:DUF1036 domain-containing protein [Xanthobacteraceae bacterium]
MVVRPVVFALLAFVMSALISQRALADFHLCNRTSYVLDIAIGLENKDAVATRGWFRIEPGQCNLILQGALEADTTYIHTRALAVYGAAPLPQGGHADLCIADGNFVIAAARSCPRSAQRLVRFMAIKPSESEKGLIANLAEEAGYTDEQARLAGIQRLLVIAGYDAN